MAGGGGEAGGAHRLLGGDPLGADEESPRGGRRRERALAAVRSERLREGSGGNAPARAPPAPRLRIAWGSGGRVGDPDGGGDSAHAPLAALRCVAVAL